MTAAVYTPRHLARSGWVVLCGDRLVRHSGTFPSPLAAEHWAAHEHCCPSGHWVIQAATHAGMR